MPPRRRCRESSSSSASEEDPDLMLDPHILLQFPWGTEAHTRLKRLIGMEIVESRTIDWSILATLGATERAPQRLSEHRVRGDGCWRWAVSRRIERSSSRCSDVPHSVGDCNRILYTGGGYYPLFLDASLDEDEAVLIDWWPVIGDEPFVNKARVSRICDPLHRYLHRCIACTITGRRLSQEWVTQKDVFFMYCLISGAAATLHVAS
ncbi:hypothetical protein E3N88_46196 [Mikania micrantha]|uniref:Uncharacterized protein n=1 Tax=Mikania micrantha TaxID=192012 RepID=A0A5N6L794_9ASTR|nr:hypothetical protein E3N88_46196 [Mikania micrantha]